MVLFGNTLNEKYLTNKITYDIIIIEIKKGDYNVYNCSI